MRRNLTRFCASAEELRVGKISGAVGTFGHIGPQAEAKICNRLGLKPAPIATQVIGRDRHAAWVNALAVAHGGANMALFACVLGLSEGEIPRLEQDLGCVNVIDFDDAGRGLVRLVNLSAHDPLKAGLWEPSFERLRRVLEARGKALAGLRWQGVDRDPEV